MLRSQHCRCTGLHVPKELCEQVLQTAMMRTEYLGCPEENYPADGEPGGLGVYIYILYIYNIYIYNHSDLDPISPRMGARIHFHPDCQVGSNRPTAVIWIIIVLCLAYTPPIKWRKCDLPGNRVYRYTKIQPCQNGNCSTHTILGQTYI